MEYAVVIKKEGNKVIVKKYDSKEKAEKKIVKSYADKKFQAEVISIPDMRIGLELYRKGTVPTYYATIIGDTKSLFFYTNLDNNPIDPIPDVVLKENLEKYFISGFLDGIESYDTKYEGLFSHIEENDDIIINDTEEVALEEECIIEG